MRHVDGWQVLAGERTADQWLIVAQIIIDQRPMTLLLRVDHAREPLREARQSCLQPDGDTGQDPSVSGPPRSHHKQRLMQLNARCSALATPAVQPAARFGDIEDLAIVHQCQDQFVCHPVTSAVRAVAFFPGAVAGNPFGRPHTNEAIHRDHRFYRCKRCSPGCSRQPGPSQALLAFL